MTDDEIVEVCRRIAQERQALPPAPPEAVAEAERVIGFAFPTLLRRLYTEVSNGGFGPIDGVPPVDVGSWQEHIATPYENGPDPSGRIPAGVVPLYDWGCTMWSMIDFRDPDGAMWSNADGDCWRQGITFGQWLVAAMDGKLRFAWPDGVPPESEWHRPNAPAGQQES
ncbi:SMI1/KNR4 family protein [Kitasatospora griseola]|uniref:SMI1/KNR4 family protein n=1 Tax=Kitasatospora griseola TaxID=2064 RepID=UPI00343BB2B4